MKTDSQLQQDVMAELKWEPSVHASQIDVAVKDGIVTLAGPVSNYLERCNAECATRRVSGVKALVLDLDVKLSALSRRNDTDIARAAEHALEWMRSPVKDTVHVVVENGWVTLSGEVRWQHQRQATEDAIRYLVGMTGLSNHIAIVPKATLEAVKTGIEAALRRHACRDARNIVVEVEGPVVTLSGSVSGWAEHQSCVHAAWSMPGVRTVVDQLEQID